MFECRIWGGCPVGREGSITTDHILFEKDHIKVTNRQVIFGGDSVLLKDITMVHVQRTEPPPLGGIVLLMLFLLVIFTNASDSVVMGVCMGPAIWMLAGGMAVLLLMTTVETFIVLVITQEKVAHIFSSYSGSAAKEIADVINKARVGA